MKLDKYLLNEGMDDKKEFMVDFSGTFIISPFKKGNLKRDFKKELDTLVKDFIMDIEDLKRIGISDVSIKKSKISYWWLYKEHWIKWN